MLPQFHSMLVCITTITSFHTTHTHTPSRWHEIFRALFLIIACHRIFLSINILGNKNGNKHSLGLQFMIFGTKQMRFRNFSLVFCFESLLKFCILQLLFEVMYQNKALECIWIMRHFRNLFYGLAPYWKRNIFQA